MNCSYISQGPLRLANRENGAQKDHVTHLKKQHSWTQNPGFLAPHPVPFPLTCYLRNFS